MLLFNILKNFGRSKVRHFGRIAANEQNQLEKINTSCANIKEKKLLRTTISTAARTSYNLERSYSNGPSQNPNHPKILLPPLTDDEIHIMPNFFVALRSSYNLYIALKGRLDRDFEMEEFMNGSKQAVQVVSEALAREDYDSLVGLLNNDLINRLREKISTLSQEQKNLIAVRKCDIYGIFPHEIDVVYEGEQDNQRTYAQIKMVYYSLKGLKEIQDRNETIPLQMGLMPEYQDKIFLCNYIFRKDYTNGETEPWIVSMCNHMTLIAA